VHWEKADGDPDVAHRVMSFLEDRRILFGKRHCEDEIHCVRSALAIGRFLTNEMGRSGIGRSLRASLSAMRAACRQFIEAAGPDACNFRRRQSVQADPFSMALGELQKLFGLHVAILAAGYDIDVEPQLRSIMQPALDDDGAPLDWMPGF
jgi:hypothetical protein